MAEKVELTDELKNALLAVVTQLERDDQFVRERNIRVWKKAEEYWRLNQFIYWDDIALDYRSIQNYSDKTGNDDDNDQVIPKVFPIYRAYGESVIAAMAASIPTVLFFPDDADNPDDITTSKAYSLISELIQRHTQAPVLFLHMLALLYNQGLVATHVSWDDDEKYGTIPIPKYKNEDIKLQELSCPRCGNILGSQQIPENTPEPNTEENNSGAAAGQSGSDVNVNPNNNQNQPLPNNNQNQQQIPGYNSELTPEEQQTVLQQKQYEQVYTCDKCGYEGQAEIGRVFDETIPRLTGYSDTPKGRINIQAYGPLNVRVSSYAKQQQDIGLLELQIEMHYAAARDEFDEIADQIQATSDYYTYERWGRTSSELLSDQLFNQVTVRYCWVRPWGFESLCSRNNNTKDNQVKDLKKKFPHGCCAIFVNDIFARAYDESMDDHWSISKNPLDSWIHGLPMGRPALDVQDAYNETKNLTLQKHQFGIAETFVDSATLDEEAYRQQQAGPGYVTFAKGQAGQPLGNSFFQTRTAAMNEEDMELQGTLNSDAQFLLGAVPSIFGGNQTTGSKTASEYNQSRNFALQRLSSHWTNVKYLWADTMSKGCRLFGVKMLEDEKYVRRNGNTFETVWIRRAELSGKVGNVEPDPSEQFPISWAQKRDLFMQMIQLQNPVIGQIMLHPNNAQNTKDALGFPEFYIPGEEDRTKQLIELRELANVNQENFPPDSKEPTIAIEPLIDNHEVHLEVLKLYCTGIEGQYLRKTNPAAYLNIMLHLQQHQAAMAPPPPISNEQVPNNQQQQAPNPPLRKVK